MKRFAMLAFVMVFVAGLMVSTSGCKAFDETITKVVSETKGVIRLVDQAARQNEVTVTRLCNAPETVTDGERARAIQVAHVMAWLTDALAKAWDVYADAESPPAEETPPPESMNDPASVPGTETAGGRVALNPIAGSRH